MAPKNKLLSNCFLVLF